MFSVRPTLLAWLACRQASAKAGTDHGPAGGAFLATPGCAAEENLAGFGESVARRLLLAKRILARLFYLTKETAMATDRTRNEPDSAHIEVHIPCGAATLEGTLVIPLEASGVVVFAHGSGSSRHSPRNQFVARVIRESGNGALLFDLLTADEEIEDNLTRRLRFDIELLAKRLVEVTRWLVAQPAARDLGIGYFGS